MNFIVCPRKENVQSIISLLKLAFRGYDLFISFGNPAANDK